MWTSIPALHSFHCRILLSDVKERSFSSLPFHFIACYIKRTTGVSNIFQRYFSFSVAFFIYSSGQLSFHSIALLRGEEFWCKRSFLPWLHITVAYSTFREIRVQASISVTLISSPHFSLWQVRPLASILLYTTFITFYRILHTLWDTRASIQLRAGLNLSSHSPSRQLRVKSIHPSELLSFRSTAYYINIIL